MKNVSIVLKTIYIFSAILLCTNLQGAFWTKKKAPAPKQERRLPFKETREYNVKVGDTFTVSLRAQRYIGNLWEWLVREPASKRFIELVKAEYQPDSPELIEGGGGKMIFTFKAKKVTKDHKEYLYCTGPGASFLICRN